MNKKILFVVITGFLLIGLFSLGAFLYITWNNAKPAFSPLSDENRSQIEETKQLIEISTQSDNEESNVEVAGGVKTVGAFTFDSRFSLSIFTENIVHPRVIIGDDSNHVLISQSNAGKVSVYDKEGNELSFIEELNRPHGLAISADKLYIAETGAILEYEYDQLSGMIGNRIRTVADLPAGGRHWTRTIGFGPDGRLYLAIGNSCNICEEDHPDRAKIHTVNLETGELSVFATGLRNNPFFTWDDDGVMYGTEMGRDWLGDDLPPDEINILEQGKDYGYPYCYGKNLTDPEYNNSPHCFDAEPSFVDLVAHEAPLGIDFIDGDMLVALHGSWNRSEPVGYEVIRLTRESNFQEREVFLTGFLQDDDTSIGRPAGLYVDQNNIVYIADDKADIVYKLSPRYYERK